MQYIPEKGNTIQGFKMAMPFLNMSFEPGNCMESISKIEDSDSRNIALGEYYYFSGQAATASDIVEEYLSCEDLALRFSACWVYAYSNISLDRTARAQKALLEIKNTVSEIDADAPLYIRALATCITTCAAALLHLPLPKILHSLKEYIHILPPGLRMFVLYVQAHHSYLNKQYGACVGIAETALAMEHKPYPVPTIYLHLVAAMGYMSLKQNEPANMHLLEAWNIAQPDDFIEPLGEHQGLLGGMLESVIGENWPNDFQRMNAITHTFSAGWRKIHSPEIDDSTANELTAIEFSVAMLVSRNWSNKEIAAHLNMPTDAVKQHIVSLMTKLNISQRKEIGKIIHR